MMRRIVAITLAVILSFMVMGLTVGCEQQSDFQRAESMMNEVLDGMEDILVDLQTMADGGAHAGELSVAFMELHIELMTEIGYGLEYDDFDFELSEEEENRLEEIFADRRDDIMGRINAVIWGE